jgi:hypothetical protein
MSYQAQAELAADQDFGNRVGACAAEQAKTKTDPLAEWVLTQPFGFAQVRFLPFIVTEPGFGAPGSAITDAQLLAAVQGTWDEVNTAWLPA